jgi:Carboxypeptidase regulatory-like domain
MKAIQINIDHPCQQDWASMQVSDGGRYCSHCEKTVVDFTSMSDDEAFHFIKAHPTVCGRFNPIQLNRPISPLQKTVLRISKFPSKLVACVLTFFSFKSFSLSAQEKKQTTTEFIQSNDSLYEGTITIQGKIIDDEEKPVSNADVFFDHQKMTTSDEDGRYSFSIRNMAVRTHTVTYSKAQYRSSTISVHPLMGDIIHNVSMCNYEGKICTGFLMGEPVTLEFVLHDFIIDTRNLGYAKKLPLTVTSKLNELATILRSNPNGKALFIFYFAKDSDKKKVEFQSKQIIMYLIEKQGIDNERLHFNLEKNAKKANTIEVHDDDE